MLSLGGCYGLNDRVSSQFIYWNNPQCDVVWRWALWEVITVTYPRESRAFTMRLKLPWVDEGTRRLSLPSEDETRRLPSVNQEGGPFQEPNLDLGIQAFRTGRNKCLLRKSPSLWHSFREAQADKDRGLSSFDSNLLQVNNIEMSFLQPFLA